MKRLFVVPALMAGLTLFGCATQPPDDAGWTTLLDGTGLDHWNRVGEANWRIVDGIVQADSSVKGAGFLVSKLAYADFEIRAEFWVSADANSGIFIRCKDPRKIGADDCYEVNIFDQAPDPAFGTGSIVRFFTVAPIYKAGGKWNTYVITAKGSQITATLNGVRTATLENKKYAKGPIALQWARGTVKFRKVQIKPL